MCEVLRFGTAWLEVSDGWEGEGGKVRDGAPFVDGRQLCGLHTCLFPALDLAVYSAQIARGRRRQHENGKNVVVRLKQGRMK